MSDLFQVLIAKIFDGLFLREKVGAVSVSSGVVDAGKIPVLGADGKIDPSMGGGGIISGPANEVYATPSSTAGNASLRPLVAADYPFHDEVLTTGTIITLETATSPSLTFELPDIVITSQGDVVMVVGVPN